MCGHFPAGLRYQQSGYAPDFVSGISPSKGGRMREFGDGLLLLLIELFRWLGVQTGQNTDLGGWSLVLDFAGGVLNGAKTPVLRLRGGGGEVQLDG